MSRAPLIRFAGIVKDYGGDTPLRIRDLVIEATDRIVLSGLDAAAAETCLHLVSGAALPDEGRVEIAGQDTRAIATDTEWLLSLDRFGVVTRRAVLLETLSTAANLALPMTTSIDPMQPETRARVEALAHDAGLDPSRLDAPCGTLDALERVRLHLARALALDPRLLLVEHPTADLRVEGDRRAAGRALQHGAERRGLGWFALSDDEAFAAESGGTRWRLEPGTGVLVRRRWWHR